MKQGAESGFAPCFQLILMFYLPELFSFYAFDFRVHFAREHIESHFVIGDQRPERVFKGGGFVFFDEEMRKPRKTVADDQTKRETNPISAPNYPNEQNQTERSSDEMKQTRQRLAVFGNVKIPKFLVICRFAVHKILLSFGLIFFYLR